MAAQLIHSAGESSPGNLPGGTHAIALTARDSAHLAEISEKLTANGIPHVPIVENCPPYRGELMAIGVSPAPRSALKRYFSSLPLVKDPTPEEQLEGALRRLGKMGEIRQALSEELLDEHGF